MSTSNALPTGYAVPNSSLPKTTGILNIVFASILILGSLGQLGMTLLGPTIMRMVQAQLDESRAKVEAQRKGQVDALKAQEAAASTEQEKAAIRSQIQAIEARPVVIGPDLKAISGQMNDPKIRMFGWVGEGTAILLNLMMLATGIGLLRLREGARRLAIWVGGLKVVRIVAITAIQAVFIMPGVAKMQQEMVAQGTANAGPNRQAMEAVAKMSIAASTAIPFLFAILAMVWPIIMILLLTRPGSRAACLAASKPPTNGLDLP